MRRILIAAMVLLLISGGALAAKQNLRGDVSQLTTDVTTGDEGEVIAALNGLQADVDTLESGIIAALVTEDINCTDDALIADDLEVGGDLTVTGSASIGGGYIASGSITDDLEMAAGKDLDCATGASEFDWSLGTGIFKTTSGAVTIGGGTNGISLNGPVTGASAKNWTMAGASYLTVGSGGIMGVGTGITLLEALTGTSAAFTGAVTSSTTITAEQITSTDDMTVTDDLSVLGDLSVAGSFTPEDLVVEDDATIGDDCDVVGDFTANTITSDGAVTATTTVQGEQVTSTDDADVVADLTAGTITSDSYVTATTAVNAANVEVSDAVNVTGNLDVDGDTTLDGLTVAEASTFNEPITIDKAIGTAPFVITSTTKVTNLNADQVDGKSSTDFCLLDGTQGLSADWDVGNFDLQMTDCRVDTDLTVLGASTLNTVVAEDLNSTDDAVVNDDLSVLGLATVGETLGVTGLTTVSAVAVGVNDTTTDENPTITASDLETLYPIDASGATVTFTLPAADTVTGRLYMIAADADMGGNNIILATTGAGKLGGTQGADTLTSTDATAAVQLVSDGTHYQIVSMRGTWT